MDFKALLYTLASILNEMSPYVLLGFLVAGLLHSFVSASAMSRHLAGRGWKPVVKAALFGVPLPLCSCGVLPAAVSLRRQGASKAASTSFLIATPQTGVDSIAATYSLLGLPFAVLRPVAALVGAFAGGVAVDRFDSEDEAAPVPQSAAAVEKTQRGFFSKLGSALHYGFVEMLGDVGKWLVAGLVVAALITVFVPDSLFTGLSRYPLLAMLCVLLVAVPMYVCATGSIPVALSLMLKGLSPGIAFVMLMAGPAANFASVIVLARTQGRKATAIYLASVAVTAIGFGLLIDLLLPRAWFVPSVSGGADACCMEWNLFSTVCSAILVGLLICSTVAARHHHHSHKHEIENDMTRKYEIKGMGCAHCKNAVESAISALPGVTAVVVDLAAGSATVSGDVSPEEVERAVRLAGFELR